MLELQLVAVTASIVLCGLLPRDRVHGLLGPGVVVALVVDVAVVAVAVVLGPFATVAAAVVVALDVILDLAAVVAEFRPAPVVIEINTTSQSSSLEASHRGKRL
jgi:hypothetical protein